MKKLQVFIACAAAMFVSDVSAQPFIEIHVKGQVENAAFGPINQVDFRMVFDASAPPAQQQPSFVVFEPIFVEAINSSGTNSDSPMFVHEPVATDPGGGGHKLSFDAPSGELSVYTVLDRLTISDPVGDFHVEMSSLPDDPQDYLLDPFQPDGEILLQAAFTTVIGWNANAGYFDWLHNGETPGSFHVSVRTVDDPRIQSCAGDINGDGKLDFFDVSAFLALYQQGCP